MNPSEHRRCSRCRCVLLVPPFFVTVAGPDDDGTFLSVRLCPSCAGRLLDLLRSREPAVLAR
jgi:hypothetical protein